MVERTAIVTRRSVNDDTAEPGMKKAEVALPDGRYLIYYTFDDDDDDDDDGDDDRDDAGDGTS